ncbi:MAG: hypothetical protein JW832_04755 [Deltaproteobacteria bacterium]|nr:hypothetical protein [Deltaproteobacteria bacterium]
MEPSRKRLDDEGGTLLEYGCRMTVRICAASRLHQERKKLEAAIRAVRMCLEEATPFQTVAIKHNPLAWGCSRFSIAGREKGA